MCRRRRACGDWCVVSVVSGVPLAGGTPLRRAPAAMPGPRPRPRVRRAYLGGRRDVDKNIGVCVVLGGLLQ